MHLHHTKPPFLSFNSHMFILISYCTSSWRHKLNIAVEFTAFLLRTWKSRNQIFARRPTILRRKEVLSAVVMKISIFWDITPCGPLKVSHRFGVTHHLQLQARKISQARNRHEAGSRQSEGSKLVPCLASLRPWRWRRCSSEISVHFQRTTRYYIPEDRTLHTFIQQTLRSHSAADTGIAFVTIKCLEMCRNWFHFGIFTFSVSLHKLPTT
jgi:hypothetical protein